MTQIGEIRILEKSFQEETSVCSWWFKPIFNGWYTWIEKNVDRMPGATNGIIYNEGRLPNEA